MFRFQTSRRNKILIYISKKDYIFKSKMLEYLNFIAIKSEFGTLFYLGTIAYEP